MSKGMGLLSKLYNAIVTSVDKFVPNRLKPFWESPAQRLSFFGGQLLNGFSMVIIPKNYNLLAVNLTVAGIQSYLIFKHLKWRSENKGNVDFEYPNHYRNPDEFW
ncbi:uncharacterized protein [Drosophila bipectinata]|uniref:uncharacterized protein isoform X2 n=1 Tax=Drosophila bipectinata TaxID=42026 RepID=UPI0038B27162